MFVKTQNRMTTHMRVGFEHNLKKFQGMKTLKKLGLSLFVFLLMSSFAAQGQKKTSKLKTYNDSVTYALAQTMAVQLKMAEIEKDVINMDLFLKTFKSIMEGNEPMMSEGESQLILQIYFQKLMEKEYQVVKAQADSFFIENGKRAEVTTTESGLQYEVIQKGTGTANPGIQDNVTVHYKGMLLDGTVFDSSYDRGEPATFGVTQVIKGWVEAIQLMKVGDKWKLYIPSDLGYGAQGAGNIIKPYSALIFEVELLGINQ